MSISSNASQKNLTALAEFIEVHRHAAKVFDNLANAEIETVMLNIRKADGSAEELEIDCTNVRQFNMVKKMLQDFHVFHFSKKLYFIDAYRVASTKKSTAAIHKHITKQVLAIKEKAARGNGRP